MSKNVAASAMELMDQASMTIDTYLNKGLRWCDENCVEPTPDFLAAYARACVADYATASQLKGADEIAEAIEKLQRIIIQKS